MFKQIIYFTLFISILLSASDTSSLKEKCQKEDATACYQIALPLISGDNKKVQEIFEEGMSYMRKACILGENRGCDVMGERYFNDKNYGIALSYLRKSCNRGVKSACEGVGTIYRDGLDTKANDVKSREFYEKACKLGSGDACYNIAMIYRGGFGIDKNRSQEKAFYQKGCKVGLKAGCIRFTELDNEDKGIETGILATIKNWFK